MNTPSKTLAPVDILCVGAGFAGLYAVYTLRNAGWNVAGYEAGDGVGGTWYWNTYPGARCDIESVYYSYSFSDELQQEWDWSERFATQPEILRYLNHCADRFDLRRSFTFNTRVVEATWLVNESMWDVRFSTGESRRTRYLVSGVGPLSTPTGLDLPGFDDFDGITVTTGEWDLPLDDLADKRVAVIGTGSSAVQCIPLIAKVAKHVTVFQRTPNYVMPARNAPLSDEVRAAVKSDYGNIRELCRYSTIGVPDREVTDAAFDVSEEERNRRYDEAYERSGFIDGVGNEFTDLLTSVGANETAAEYLRSKVREIVTDPATASLLEPRFHPLGAKRSCFGTDYYETFNRRNVDLVSLRKESLEKISAGAIVTTSNTYPIDALVVATGFDAFTGSLFALDLRTSDGLTLREAWADGVRTYLGIMSAGFPNFFMIGGPQSPGLASNFVVTIEQAVDWVAALLNTCRVSSNDVVQATIAAQDDWVNTTESTVNETLYATTDSWYRGSNVAGKPSTFLGYVGGVGTYRRICEDIAAAGYPGLRLTAAHADGEGRQACAMYPPTLQS